jgi:hypothetical protein
MFRIRLGVDARVPVRIAVSPLTNLLSALSLVLAGVERETTPAWRRMLAGRLAGVDTAPLAPLGEPGLVWTPPRLQPVPAPGTSAIADELRAMSRTPPASLRAEIVATCGDAVPPVLRPFVDEPDAALAGYCTSLAAAWEALLAPDWRRMLSLLEREVVLLSRGVALSGLSEALPRLHERIRYEPGWLVLDVPLEAEVELGERYLLLVPLAVGESRIIWDYDDPDVVLVSYPAPGMLAFWERNELAYSERLAQVVGTPRARILSALSTPMTQKDLTDALHLTNGPVGTQLAALTTAGLLDRARVGKRVFYRLSDRGEQLLVVFGDD